MMNSPSKVSEDVPVTVASLLSSLHSHLQEQTQLLPTLHAQLGLPQSALTDELTALRQRLAACIEEQIELRREEVDNWMKKCDDIERACLKYAKALGAHTKTISASVGELRKQQVLPVRYEMLSQHQDKLTQLYKTKLEQFMNLSNRITSLSRILGSDFFSLDVAGQHLFSESLDDQQLRDVNPDRFSKLEKELVRGKAEITRRLQHLSETFLTMDWLYNELDIAPLTGNDDFIPSPSSSRKPSGSCSVDDPFASSVSSMSTPTPCPRGKRGSSSRDILLSNAESSLDYCTIYNTFISRIDEAEASGKTVDSNSLIGLEGIEPTVGLMEWADRTKDELEDIKRRREAAIQALYDQLEPIWRRLGVEDEDIDLFVEHNRGSKQENVQAYEQELERMLELKRERMSVFVGNARAEIEALWDELMISDTERADFAPFADDEHTEELLALHEEEIGRLKEERKLRAPLLASIRKYFDICEEEKELATAAQDQSRLLGRGPRDPGRLLREEKMRKRVRREKPKLEQELLRLLPAWGEAQGKPFLVNGINVIEVLQETITTIEKENPKNKKERAGSAPPRPIQSKTPVPVPMQTRGAAALSSSAGNPNKRQRIASSSSAAPKQRPSDSESESLPHRVPFGSRAGAANRNMQTPIAETPAPQITIRKRIIKTPAAVASSSTLPRPTSAFAHPGPTPSTTATTTIRTLRSATLGNSTSHVALPSGSSQRRRATSTSATATKVDAAATITGAAAPSAPMAKTYGILVDAFNRSQTSRSAAPPQQPARVVRNSRRESFRPRTGADNEGPWAESLAAAATAASRYVSNLTASSAEK